MKTILLNATIGADGLLKIETPTEYKNISAEIVLVHLGRNKPMV